MNPQYFSRAAKDEGVPNSNFMTDYLSSINEPDTDEDNAEWLSYLKERHQQHFSV